MAEDENYVMHPNGEEWHVWIDYERGKLGIQKEGYPRKLVDPYYARLVAGLTRSKFPNLKVAQEFADTMDEFADKVEQQ